MAKSKRSGIRHANDEGSITVVSEERDAVLPSIPPPADVERYEQNYPGFMKQVMAMAERQQNYSIDRDKDLIEKSYRLNVRTQIIVTIISLAILSLGFYSLYKGVDWPASVAPFVSAAALIITFIILRKK